MFTFWRRESSERNKYYQWKYVMRKKYYEVEDILSREEFSEILSRSCVFCELIKPNSIEIMDWSKPPTKDNCVGCCKFCKPKMKNAEKEAEVQRNIEDLKKKEEDRKFWMEQALVQQIFNPIPRTDLNACGCSFPGCKRAPFTIYSDDSFGIPEMKEDMGEYQQHDTDKLEHCLAEMYGDE
jgi:hypothetical protein